MTMPIVLRVIWVAAGLAMLLGRTSDAFQKRLPDAKPLARLEGGPGSSWFSGGFRVSGAYPTTEAGLLPDAIPHAGSWLDGDQWQGRAESEWFAAPSAVVRVGVAGYPQLPGCTLSAEFRRADGSVTRADCRIPNPRERWGVWSIRLPRATVAVRIVAEDRTGAHAGWIAFSHPFTSWAAEATAVYQFLQVFTTLALALMAIWAPGVMLHAWAMRRKAFVPEWQTVLVVGSGPLILASLGLAIWCTSGAIRPQTFAGSAILVGWIGVGVWFARRGFRVVLGRSLVTAFALSAIVSTAVVAKSFYSIGPPGELFRGTVSRNFEMADRIDSRYSFYVVQAATLHLHPASPEAEKFFFPWTFFSRGPLAGLVTTPVVLATAGVPPAVVPETRWTPYDKTGFAAYRITMIVMASGIIVTLFLVLVPLVGERWSLIAAGLLALSPFGMHEMMFTWPKWAATIWLVAGFGLAHARRPLGAGIVLGFGFMFHPLVLLWSPWIALWTAARSERRVVQVVLALTKIGGGCALIVVPWMAIGSMMPHLSTTPLPGQLGFLHYWARADWKIPTWETWWATRWMNFANTFIPLHLFLSDASFNHPKLNSAYETSGTLIRFSQLWWNTLPFAMGLGAWAISVIALIRAARTMLATLLLLVVAPALFITAYWGMDPLGLMRECGHPLFVTLIALTCIVAARHGGWISTVLQHRAFPWLQLPETWLMLWLTSLLNLTPWAADHDHLDSIYLTINALALFAAPWVLSAERRFASSSDVTSSPAQTVPV